MSFNTKVTAGVIGGICLAVAAGITVYFTMPPVPLGAWEWIIRVVISGMAGLVVFSLVWIITVMSVITEVGHDL